MKNKYVEENTCFLTPFYTNLTRMGSLIESVKQAARDDVPLAQALLTIANDTDNPDCLTARQLLFTRLGQADLGLEVALGKLKEKMEAKHLFVTRNDRIEWPDHAAQLRAVETVLALHEKAGAIPSNDVTNTPQMGINVTVTNFNLTVTKDEI